MGRAASKQLEAHSGVEMVETGAGWKFSSLWHVWKSFLLPFIKSWFGIKLFTCTSLSDKNGRWNNWLWSGSSSNQVFVPALEVTPINVIILVCDIQGSPKHSTQLGMREICFLRLIFSNSDQSFTICSSGMVIFLFSEALRDVELNGSCCKYYLMVCWHFRNDSLLEIVIRHQGLRLNL